MTGADVLMIGGEPYDPDVARLLIFEVPAARALTRRQNQGGACVWCGATEDLETLGAGSVWRPQGCPSCRQVRARYLRAYLAWKRHVQACTECRVESCSQGLVLGLAHQEMYEATGKGRPVICACGCPVALESLRLRPYFAESLISLRYSHAGVCGAPEVPAPAGNEATP